MKLVPCEKVIRCEEHGAVYLINSHYLGKEAADEVHAVLIVTAYICSDVNEISSLIAVIFTLRCRLSGNRFSYDAFPYLFFKTAL